MTPRALDRDRLSALLAGETDRFVREHPRSHALHERARGSLLDGVPMNWMVQLGRPIPALRRLGVGRALHAASTATTTSTSASATPGRWPAMARHRRSPPWSASSAAASPTCSPPRMRRGPARSCVAASACRLAVHALRDRRQPVRPPPRPPDHRPLEGASSTTSATTAPSTRPSRRSTPTAGRRVGGSIGPQVDVATTTRVVEFNDVDGLERRWRIATSRRSSCEPALTNVGIVLPEPGYLRGRARPHPPDRAPSSSSTRPTRSVPVPAAATGAWGLEPDMLVIGKTDRRRHPGRPRTACPARSADRVTASIPVEDSDIGGIGGTLAGYALSLAAIRATLGEVLTDAAFERMIPLAERWEAGVNGALRARGRAVARHPPRGARRVPLHALDRRGPAPSSRPTPTTSSSVSSTSGR